MRLGDLDADASEVRADGPVRADLLRAPRDSRDVHGERAVDAVRPAGDDENGEGGEVGRAFH